MNNSTSRTPLTCLSWQELHMPPDCCPTFISKQFSWCAKCIPKSIEQRWTYLRSRAHQLVEHRFFEWLIVGSILASSTTLVSPPKPQQKKYFDICFSHQGSRRYQHSTTTDVL